MKRVKYYSNIDMSLGYNVKIAIAVIEKYKKSQTSYEINDILEFINVLKLLDSKFLDSLSDKEQVKYKSTIKDIKKSIALYAANINESNIIENATTIDVIYIEDFFELIDKYNIYERISSKIFLQLMTLKGFIINYALRYKGIVKHYDLEIKEYLIDNPACAVLLLNEYELAIVFEKEPLVFPHSLLLEDKEKMLINYINSGNANLNYLRVISNMHTTSSLRVSDRTRLLAKKNVEKREKDFFSENFGFKMSLKIKFEYGIGDRGYIFENDNNNWLFTYNLDWIENNTDFSTLLNNFIYLFEFVDSQMRWTMVNKNSQMGSLEKYIVMNVKRGYPVGIVFKYLNQLSDLQMKMYYEQLQKSNIRLEDLIECFFSDYIKNEFAINNYIITMPSKDSTYLEKCRAILPEIDSCLKQFNIFTEDGFIDQELLQISSNHLLLKNVKSLLSNKYVYAKHKKFDVIGYYLFSEQCMLRYIPEMEKKYENFYELITNENIKETDIVESEKTFLNKLISDNYIYVDSDNFIKFTNINKINILKDIYENDVISYWKLNLKNRSEVDQIVKDDILTFESSLFSKPEQNYLNYYLNKSKFVNSLDLRNMYSHGTQPQGDENIHYYNYIRFLRMFILIIIKINDEFCIQSDLKSNA